MADHDDATLRGAFANFRAEALDEVTPAGPATVRSIVRRRRRASVTGGAALALILVVGPVAGYAALNRGPAPPPQPGNSATPTPAPTPSTNPSPTASAPPTVPDGRIDRADLLRAKVDLPPWWFEVPCRASGARLSPEPVNDGDNWLAVVAYGDVDKDGSVETVALIRCTAGQAGPAQVVAFDRNHAGQIVTLGRVVRTSPDAQWITDMKTRQNGTVQVELADLAPGGGWPLELSQRQWRGYGWNGREFRQVDGPTKFKPNPGLTDLNATATNAVFEKDANTGRWSGTVTVTIHNDGPSAVEHVFLSFDFGPGRLVRYEGSGWSRCVERSQPTPDGLNSGPSCLTGKLFANETLTLVLGLSSDQPGSGSGTVSVSNINKARDRVPDLTQDDNIATFQFR